MVILLVLMLLAPAIISVLLFERFKGTALSLQNRIAWFFVFAFLINMTVFMAIWLRGREQINLTLDNSSDLIQVAFCVKYMALSLLAAVAIPFAINLIKVGKSK